MSLLLGSGEALTVFYSLECWNEVVNTLHGDDKQEVACSTDTKLFEGDFGWGNPFTLKTL